MRVLFKIKERKWYKKILGFRSGKWWKSSIASFGYIIILISLGNIIFAEDSGSTNVSKSNTQAANAEVQEETKETESKKLADEKQKQEEAARLAEEQRKQQEAARLAEEQQKQQEAARLAEEQQKQQEADRLAEEQRKQQEAARLAEEQQKQAAATNVYYKNCTEVRNAGAAPIHQGEPGYASHLDRDGDGIACDR
ncbi:excalibur calcium-binding domain-containing protein [Ectobacillus funiculus]